MKKVLFIAVCSLMLIPLYAAEVKDVSKDLESRDITFVSSFDPSNITLQGEDSSLELQQSDDKDKKTGSKQKKAKKSIKKPEIDYEAFAQFKLPLLIGAIAFTSITGILLITGTISGGITGYYIQLGHYDDEGKGIELVKLIGSSVYTGVAWSFFTLLFLPLTVVLWVGYAFARKGSKTGGTAFLSNRRVAFNPLDCSLTIKLH